MADQRLALDCQMKGPSHGHGRGGVQSNPHDGVMGDNDASLIHCIWSNPQTTLNKKKLHLIFLHNFSLYIHFFSILISFFKIKLIIIINK